jgi:chemotaxis regulatin CheY-phosphate phosphatase CheZ
MMEQTYGTQSIHAEIKSIREAVDAMVQHLKQQHGPMPESGRQVSETTGQPEKISRQTEESTHLILDMVERVSNDTGDLGRDLKVLRKALPATYFKNRSKVRDTFERIESISDKCKNNALAIVDALQFQEMTSRQIEHTSQLLDEVESKLNSIKEFFDSNDFENEKRFDGIVHTRS